MSGAEEARYPAPGKLNLFLHVRGRRADGYHELQTLFQFIDWCDVVGLRPLAGGEIRRPAGPAGVPAASDLTVRAARLLQRHSGCRQGVEIRIDKHLPMGGGLGGGSSDAATVLVALNQLWALGLGEAELQTLALTLGADVPIFVAGYSAWAEGVGERLRPARPPEAQYLLLVPPVQVETGAVFRDRRLTRNSPPATMMDFMAGRTRNDCESVVALLHPEIGAALQWLRRHVGEGHLTGTGACVFARVAGSAITSLLAQAPAAWSPRLVRGLNVSPLRAAVGS